MGIAEGAEESRNTTQGCSPERIPRHRTSLSAQTEGGGEEGRTGACRLDQESVDPEGVREVSFLVEADSKEEAILATFLDRNANYKMQID